MVGAQDFANVTNLVKSGMNVCEAISQVATDRGATRGAVTASYYAAKRKSAGGAMKARRASQRFPETTPVPAKVNGRGDVNAITRDLIANVQALAEAVKAQDAEVSELRSRLGRLRVR